MKIINVKEIQRSRLDSFFTTHWGSPEMVISSGVYDCSALDGFAFLNENGDILGIVTYVLRDRECEIISLDSIYEGRGIGSNLVSEVERVASEYNCTAVKLVTTNDNLAALKFYQKRGYQLSNLFQNAVAKARHIKPKIPLIGHDGIPIRDELELQKLLMEK